MAALVTPSVLHGVLISPFPRSKFDVECSMFPYSQEASSASKSLGKIGRGGEI
jgi:hypothetical protein